VHVSESGPESSGEFNLHQFDDVGHQLINLSIL
jgi:hypothetical protein